MGWASGSDVMSAVIYGLNKKIDDEEIRKIVYRILIDALEDQDWDTQEDNFGEDVAYDEALREAHPTWDLA